MATDVLKLKKQAISLGMDKSQARSANRSTLEAFIAKAGKPKSSGVAKKKGTTVAKKKAAPAKKGNRPTGKAKAPAAKKSATTGKAKRANSRKVVNSGNGGRHVIGSLDFSVTEGWAPREGSPVAVIFKALKKCKGNVDRTFDALAPNYRDFVSARKADGSKRSKDEMLTMLRYRINRTKFQFALQTGQHQSSTERVQYGTGDYASTRKKKATPKRNIKPNTRKAPAKSKAKAGKGKRR
jgi:hypothetical protein